MLRGHVLIDRKPSHGHMHRNADWSNGPFHIGCGKLVEKIQPICTHFNKKEMQIDQRSLHNNRMQHRLINQIKMNCQLAKK